MKNVNVRKVLLLAIIGAVSALVTTGGLVAGQTAQPTHEPINPRAAHKPADTTSSVGETAKARFAAAERVCKILHDLNSGEPRGHQGVEHTYLWSKRRMEAQIDMERTRPGGGDGGTAAIERHVEWMRSWHEQVVKAGTFSGFEVASTEFYVAEAEDLLARAKTK